ncbi:U6 snRNA-associated Sm-like protein LSm6 [Carpediemonas membranifera]|uniref:U6 snRNA-associated Sm-like protein LSm6 n=1 Tax=Carpediemonas membranifera TaxID=201153 RepID=A0A8J6AZP5_9EUKA|nr:U6 snRNA-associated Sm-like protein LSm6 [Carpediemonas membranifera]|eukprot:KAG9391144.1 U6 snRNA-associated Sm-like protein LSm6 [Carpediemonas membranifera]
MSTTNSSSDFLNGIIGERVVVKLVDGTTYRGILVCIDATMNVVLEQAEEFFEQNMINKFGDAFIRGSRLYYIGCE